MTHAEQDAANRKAGVYSHIVQYTLVDGEHRYFRQITVHARHVAETMQRLVPFANAGEIHDLRVNPL